jgi:hypothetical protein
MDIHDFMRLHAVRAPKIMWFLGAGASAAAGIPTAYHMVWEFKRTLFCAAQRVPRAAVADLADPSVQSRLQRHFDALGGFPAQGADEEYADFFEAAYPSEADRRVVIDRAVSSAAPSYGHLVLAALMRVGRARVVWTTNFDPMVEDAVASVFETTGKLTTATPDGPDLARQALSEERWPLLVKLHGDFRSRRLRNTSEELNRQDAQLRDALVHALGSYGLAVTGYSGRDHSVLEALERGIDAGRGYPAGLLWFHRSTEQLLPAVEELLAKAQTAGVEAAAIPLETFDELMGDLLHLEQTLPDEIAAKLEQARPRRVSDAPLPKSGGTFPVIRMNAFPVVEWPSTCRLVACKIGGTSEVRQVVADANADLIVGRRNTGVIAFGSDSEIRRAFRHNEISRLDLHVIEGRRLRYDSAEHGLLYEALTRAIERELPLISVRHGPSRRLVVDPKRADDSRLQSLRLAAGRVSGNVAGTELTWCEAAEIRLEYRLDGLWLLLDPTIAVLRVTDQPLPEQAKEFIRERQATRYNKKANDLIDAWRDVIFGGDQEIVLRAFGLSDGVDAAFKLDRVTAFSYRSRG